MQGLIAQQGMPIKFAEVGFIVQNRVKQTAAWSHFQFVDKPPRYTL